MYLLKKRELTRLTNDQTISDEIYYKKSPVLLHEIDSMYKACPAFESLSRQYNEQSAFNTELQTKRDSLFKELESRYGGLKKIMIMANEFRKEERALLSLVQKICYE